MRPRRRRGEERNVWYHMSFEVPGWSGENRPAQADMGSRSRGGPHERSEERDHQINHHDVDDRLDH